jgi:CRP-like cAMP-binding protein
MYSDDKMKNWAFDTMKQLPFLQEIERDNENKMLHKIFYSLKKKSLKDNNYIYKPGDEIKQLRIIQDGVVEIFILIDEKEFLLDRLMRGSILNPRTFFLNQQS